MHLLRLCSFRGLRVRVHVATRHKTSHLLDLKQDQTQLNTILNLLQAVQLHLARDHWDEFEDFTGIQQNCQMQIRTYSQSLTIKSDAYL